ncbi:MAG: signal peptidase II [Deltaproteobacteria bacterium]|nr:signal peptidase II [Deltaproteobacteria bacterium]
MRGKWGLVFAPALVVVGLDRLTKALVLDQMTLHESIPVIDGFFALTYVRNTGAAFGIFAGLSAAFRVPALLAIATLALGVLLWFVRTVPLERRAVIAACGGVLGGAIGNMIDRTAYGEVIDFLDVYLGAYHWPAFNVADAAITVGVIVLCLDALWSPPAPARSLV